MPELPEVETMRRGLLPIVNGVLTDMQLPEIPYRPIHLEPGLTEFRRRIMGAKVVTVDRIAKRVLVRLSTGDSIVMQPKMAGLALLADPPSPQHTRVVFKLRGAAVDRFLYWDRRGLGNVCLWTPEQVDKHLGPSRLGPDASIADQQTFVGRFHKIDREVKVALLDQKLVCGIGNLYAAEILHAAKVHPQQRCQEISRTAWIRIYQETIRILNEAIENEGSTLSDGTYRNALNGEGSYQARHLVYDRAESTCMTCQKTPILRIVQAQRSTFFCPKCQKLRT